MFLVVCGYLALKYRDRPVVDRSGLWTRAVRELSASRVRHDGTAGFDLLSRDGPRLVARLLDYGKGQVAIEYSAERGIPPELTIGAEGFSAALAKLVLGSDIETGDDAFDRAIVIRGAEVSVLALLDARTRGDIVRAVVTAGVTVSAGSARLVVHGSPGTVSEIVERARTVARLAQSLTERARLPAAVMLRDNAIGDPVAGVRRRCLALLMDRFPDSDETRTALEAAAADPDPSIRLLASSRGDGSAADDLAALAGDANVADEIRVDALGKLLGAYPGARSLAVAERALGDRSPDVRCVAIAAIGRARRPGSAVQLIPHAMKSEHAGEQLVLAQAFWRLRDDGAEAALFRLLEAGLTTEVRVEAARALGRCGTIRAVEPLHRIRGLFRTELGRVADESIAAIQARLVGAGEGQLTVTEASAQQGQVSVKDDAGAVSLSTRGKKDPA